MIKFYAEIGRKLIHISSLWISALYIFNSKEFMLTILVPLALLSIFIDSSRRYFPFFHRFINSIIGFMMREEEREKFAFVGATYLLCASAISVFFFSKEIAIFSLSILSVCDSFSAIVGRKFGKHKLVDNKTLEGSLAFLISGICVYLFYAFVLEYKINFLLVIISLISATIVELFSKRIKLDDNFSIPIVVGMVLSL